MESIKNWLDELELDVVGWRKIFFPISALAVLVSWAIFVIVGPNWGIDFTGGTEIHLAFEEQVDISEVRAALNTLGLSDDSVQELGGSQIHEFTVRIQDPTFGMEELVEEVRQRLTQTYGEDWLRNMEVSAEVGARMTVTYAGPELLPADVAQSLTGVEGVQVQAGGDENQVVITVPGLSQLIEAEIGKAMGGREFRVLSTDAVGPQVGGDLRREGFIAVAATLGLILVYIAFRFDLIYAPGAIIGLFHDLSLTIGIFTLLQLEFGVSMIGALLTLVGYSLNDTIVVYDRIRENQERFRRKDLAELINSSVSETFTRTFATSLTTLMAVSPFLIWGTPVIRNFALAMSIGVVAGTYSTIFVASPLIVEMEKLKPYLSRLVVGGPGGGESGPPAGEEGEEEPGKLTQSELRRRERAEAERREGLT